MPPPTGVEKSHQILVEGREAEGVMRALCAHLHLDVQLQNFGGLAQLRGFVKAFRRLPAFEDVVQTVLVIRDAEDFAAAAFDSAADALAAADLTRPARPAQLTGAAPRTGVFVLPGGGASGMLETLCLRAVRDLPAFECIGQFVHCVEEANGIPPHPPDKAMVQAYLASTRHAGIALRDAGSAGLFPWDHPAFEALRIFLLSVRS